MAQTAYAHYTVMSCQFKPDSQRTVIDCEVGFTDGSKAVGKTVKLFSYDEELLATKKSDRISCVQFQKPAGEYYIFFDSGHEFPVEVDYGEL